MGSVRRVRWWRTQTVVTAFALVAALTMVPASPAASSENESYRLPWDATETWQISRGPSDSGSHPSSYGYSAWDIFPVSLDEGIRTLAVGNGTASVFCDDGHQAHVKLATDQGDTFHYAHLDSESVSDAGITTDGVRVIQGQSVGTLYHDTDGYSLPCGSGTGPHLHFEIATAGLPLVIDGYTFSLSQQHGGEQLASTNTYVPGSASSFDLLSVAELDLGQDEVFLYRGDGTFRYYDVSSNGILGAPILAGDGYTTDWSAITAVDLDGDGQDEMFFYRDDGLFRYYNINPDGILGAQILAGDGYTTDWSAITAIQLDNTP